MIESMIKRSFQSWDAFWHKDEVTRSSFDFFRIFFYGTLFCIFLSDYYGQFFVNLATAVPALVQPTWFDACFSWVPRTVESHTVIRFVFLGSCIVAAIGFLSPLMKISAAATGFYMLNVLSSFGNWNHSVGPTAIALILLCFIPCSYRFSIDGALSWGSRAEPQAWFVKLFQVIVVWSYFSSGLYKLFYGGVEWVSANSLYNYLLLSNYLEKQTNHEWLAAVLTTHPTLCWALGLAAFVIELGSPLAFVQRRLGHLIFVCLALLQVTIYFSLKENFVMSLTLLPLLFMGRAKNADSHSAD